MTWQKTASLVSKFENVYIRLSNRVETANNWNKQLGWKSYREDYLKLVREAKSRFRSLKNDLKNKTELIGILKDLETSLKKVFDINSETKTKFTDLSYSKTIWVRFKKELDKKIKQEYDLFPKRDFEVTPKLCFVLMPFDRDFNKVYSEGIKPAIKKAKLQPKRADEIFTSSSIIQDIWQSINKSSILIADVTGRNPNVFYEVGLSHAIPKRLIIITQNKKDVPFDIQHLRWIHYTNTQSGRKSLSPKILRAIKAGLS